MTTYANCYLFDNEIFLTPPARPNVVYRVDKMLAGDVTLTEFYYHPAKPDELKVSGGGVFDAVVPPLTLPFEVVKHWEVHFIAPSPMPLYTLPLAQYLSENLPIKNLPTAGVNDYLYIVGDDNGLTLYRMNDEYQWAELPLDGRLDIHFKVVVSYSAFKAWVSLGGNAEHLYISALSLVPNPTEAVNCPYVQIRTSDYAHTANFVGHSWNDYGGLSLDDYRASDDYMPVFQSTYGAFYKAWQFVKTCAAKDDNRPVLEAIYLSLNSARVTLAAADGFRLAKYVMWNNEYQVSNLPIHGYALLIPAYDKSLSLLLKNKPTKKTADNVVTIAYCPAKNTARITIGGSKVDIQLIEGKFPDYESIIPKKHSLMMTTQTAELLAAVERALVYAKDTAYCVAMEVVSNIHLGEIHLQAYSNEKGNFQQLVSTLTDGSLVGRLSFNGVYLRDSLKVWGGEDVQLFTNKTTDPILLQSLEGNQQIVIMSMRGEYKPPAPVIAKPAHIADSGIINRYRDIATIATIESLLSTVENLDAAERTNTTDGMLYHLRGKGHISKALQYQRIALTDVSKAITVSHIGKALDHQKTAITALVSIIL